MTTTNTTITSPLATLVNQYRDLEATVARQGDLPDQAMSHLIDSIAYVEREILSAPVVSYDDLALKLHFALAYMAANRASDLGEVADMLRQFADEADELNRADWADFLGEARAAA